MTIEPLKAYENSAIPIDNYVIKELERKLRQNENFQTKTSYKNKLIRKIKSCNFQALIYNAITIDGKVMIFRTTPADGLWRPNSM